MKAAADILPVPSDSGLDSSESFTLILAVLWFEIAYYFMKEGDVCETYDGVTTDSDPNPSL